MNNEELRTVELLLSQTLEAQEELQNQETNELLGEKKDFSKLGTLLWCIEKNLELLKNN